MRKPALKHFILSFFLALASYLLIAVLPVSAQAPNSYAVPVNNPDVPQNLHTYTQNTMIEVMSAMICQLSGVDPIQKDHQCLGIDPLNQRIGYVQGTQSGVASGVIGTVSNLISYTFQLPVSSSHYFSYLASNFGIVKSAIGASPVSPGVNSDGTTGVSNNATTGQSTSLSPAKTGFESLAPIMGVWSRIRDVVYVIFVVGFVIIGIGIMLRVKIDPRTVMTIQNRIPKLIAGILLVTFSYAIAGFLIDVMWMTIYLLVNLFASVDPWIANDINKFYSVQGANVFNYASSSLGIENVASGANKGVQEVVSSMMNNTPGKIISYFLGFAIGGSTGLGFAKTGIGLATKLGAFVQGAGWIGYLISGLVGVTGAAIGTLAADKLVPAVTGLITHLIILIAICSALFRLWFKLLGAFIGLIFGMVLAPLWIFAGLIPGNKLGFGSWLKHMLTNLIVFPMTVGMFLVGKVVIDMYNLYEQQHAFQGFVPPLVGYGGTGAPISALIGLGLILITPNVTKFAQDIFRGQKLDVSPIGQSLKAGTGTITGGFKPVAAAVTKTPQMGQVGGFSAAARQIFKF
jgi:hypothetical protein